MTETRKVVTLDPSKYDSLLIEFKPDAPEPAPPAIPPGAKAIDVSKWQGVIDWTKVKTVARLDYVMVRATNGLTPDDMFLVNWQSAREAGIKRGAYHYWQNELGAGAQAEAFIAAQQLDFGELPWALDIEDQQPPFTKTEMPDVRIFLDTVEAQTGKRGFIYTGRSVWNFPTETWATDYQLWQAAYSTSGYLSLPPWPQPCLWQHTSRGVISGITANTVDLNTAGDGLTKIVPDWFWRGSTSERPDPATGKHPQTFFVKAVASPITLYDAPGGKEIKSLVVSWRMAVSSITTDGWLMVYKSGPTEWWIRAVDVTLSQ